MTGPYGRGRFDDTTDKEGVESYIVRIYRRLQTPGHNMVGVVEDAVQETRAVFRNFEELKTILLRLENPIHP